MSDTFPFRNEFDRMKSAVMLMVLDSNIRTFLLKYDPMAFNQAYTAVRDYLTQEQVDRIQRDVARNI